MYIWTMYQPRVVKSVLWKSVLKVFYTIQQVLLLELEQVMQETASHARTVRFRQEKSKSYGQSLVLT